MLKVLNRAPRVVASALSFVESARAMERVNRDHRISAKNLSRALVWLEQFEADCEVFPLDQSVLWRARQPFPAGWVRTLDALHLATALLWRDSVEDLSIVSMDDRLRENAVALGFELLP